jgi:hypothetical protein
MAVAGFDMLFDDDLEVATTDEHPFQTFAPDSGDEVLSENTGTRYPQQSVAFGRSHIS